MLWADRIPKVDVRDAEGRVTTVTVVAGAYGEAVPPAPPPRSWASRPGSNVAVWALRLEPGARFELPASEAGVTRNLYFFAGSKLTVADRTFDGHAAITVSADRSLVLRAGDDVTEVLMLQGRPIAEPVVQYGPFVMNTPAEIQQAMADYRRTRFGGWPFADDAPTHPREAGRFARHVDGRVEHAEATEETA